jgi:hypothetical protein
MNDPTNGTQAPPPTLSDAIQAHAQALLKANAMPNGMMAINPAQLYCDLELAQVRIEVLFEAGSAALCQASAPAGRAEPKRGRGVESAARSQNDYTGTESRPLIHAPFVRCLSGRCVRQRKRASAS